MGKCPACGEWNTFTEEVISRGSGIGLWTGEVPDAASLLQNEDIQSVEVYYTSLETDLRIRIQEAGDAADYDEVIYNAAEIEYDSFELMAFLILSLRKLSL